MPELQDVGIGAADPRRRGRVGRGRVEAWSQPLDPHWWGLLLASFVTAAVVTGLSIRYAHRRQLIDLPGQRRSHTVPTPRGGGIGIVVAVLITLAISQFVDAGSILAWPRLAIAITLVALVGWIDDHGGLRARWRFLAHCAASTVLLAPLFAKAYVWSENGSAAHFDLLTGGVVLLLIVATVWSINLHNFMDGIDGILSTQALFVFLALFAVIYPQHNAGDLPIWAAAVLGFLPFNFPRARVFMGDVGSGVLGLLIAVAVLLQLFTPSVAQCSGILVCCAFVTDASCTLLSRMIRGRRWYSAHREHLYQWMARTGMSHARVVGWYAAWNLLVVAPVLWCINRAGASLAEQYGCTFAVYALCVSLWIFGKRWCLHNVKNGYRHAPA